MKDRPHVINQIYNKINTCGNDSVLFLGFKQQYLLLQLDMINLLMAGYKYFSIKLNSQLT